MLMIVGSERSGTTWLGKLFDSHPDTLYIHEPDTIRRDYSFPVIPLPEDIEPYLEQAREYLDQLPHIHVGKTMGRPPAFPKSYRGQGAAKVRQAIITAIRLIERVPGLPQYLLSVPHLGDYDAAIPVIKSVSSLSRLSLYAKACPEIQFVHLMRHPCGVTASQKRGIEKSGMTPNLFLEELLERPEAKHYPITLKDLMERPLTDQLAFTWMFHNDKAVLETEGFSNITPLQYEDLCMKPVKQMSSLFALAGLQTDWQSLEFIEKLNALEEKGAAYFSVMRSPGASVNKWKDELSSEEISGIENIVRMARSKRLRSLVENTLTCYEERYEKSEAV